MLSAYLTSLIRTGTGYAVAWLLSLKFAGPALSLFGVSSATGRERLTAGLVLVLGTVYYALVRYLERRWPQLGVLLGIPSKPTYAPALVTSSEPPKGFEYPPSIVAAAPGTPDQPAGTQPQA